MYINVAAYKFVPLSQLKRWKRSLSRLCHEQQLKGSILLSPEGINLFVAGSESAVNALLHALRSSAELADLEIKRSESTDQPFRRMLVKIKKEIIAFGVETIKPAYKTSPKLTARELKRWLDEGRDIELLDVRNDYEVELGTFQGATTLDLDTFRQLPNRVRSRPVPKEQRPIVMFCTGGIRCEKAGPFMEDQGFREVYQLEGGILKYFEECGRAHFAGDCFVFDHRVALNPELEETSTGQCFACRAALSVDDQQSPHYVRGKSCPRCYRTAEEQARVALEKRMERLRRATDPLPGSQPYTNRRTIHIPAHADGMQFRDHLIATYPFVPANAWDARFAAGLLVLEDRPVSANHPVRVGQRYEHWFPETVEPDVASDIRILHEDDALVVVHKPAPLPMHPCGRYNRNTLSEILQSVYQPQQLRLAHRLDANTSGVVVFSRTSQVAARIQPQFADGAVKKRYLCRVWGRPDADTFQCNAAISARSTSRSGGREIDPRGLSAFTRFKTLARFPDETSLVEAIPVTGRTNQIRIHLWHLGFPVCGDPMYGDPGRVGERQTLSPDEPPLCLHAWAITLTHPLSGQSTTYEAEPPDWASPLPVGG